MKWGWLILLLILETGCITKQIDKPLSAEECFTNTRQNFGEIFNCYRQAQENKPLTYTSKNQVKDGEIEIRRYELTSQNWPLNNIVTPSKWIHQVTIMIPKLPYPGKALLVINNGTHGFKEIPAKDPSDFSDEVLRAISKETRTIVISVSDVPNQPLIYQTDDKPKVEDFSVAYTWSQFLNAPQEQLFMPLQIPMMQAAVKSMDLAEKELTPWKINQFIVTGISKRGWASWHTAITDKRIAAIIPFVFDALDFRKFMQHTYKTYGQNWPIALMPYHQQDIHKKYSSPNFDKLMRIIDPIEYLDSPYIGQLNIPKYIVNASGDDFFPADSARLYFNKLPGETVLRIVPNSDHGGIKQHTQQSVVNFLKRIQQSAPLPTLTSNLSKRLGGITLSIGFSEHPKQLIQWTAINTEARDFRYACNIKYIATRLDPTFANEANVLMPKPSEEGWVASFVEAHFADDFIATTPVYILPNELYPTHAPQAINRACQTIPGKIEK